MTNSSTTADLVETLTQAVEMPAPALVKMLLEGRGEDIRNTVIAPARGPRPRPTPFEAALRSGNEEICLLLVAHGETRCRKNVPVLEWAGFNAAVTRALLDAGADAREVNPRTGAGPAYACAAHGSPDAMRLLAAAGADLNTLYSGLTSPLDVAAMEQRPEMVELLLELGADCAPRRGGCSALHTAAIGFPDTSARRRSLPDFKRVVELLMDAGLDINGIDSITGNTPLHLAALTGWVPAFAVLLSRGAAVLPRSTDGATPLDVARAAGRQDAYAALQAHVARSEILRTIAGPAP